MTDVVSIGVANLTDIAGEGIFAQILGKMSFFSALLQALGGLLVLYVIFSIISAIKEKKRIKLLTEIRDSLKVIEKKLKK